MNHEYIDWLTQHMEEAKVYYEEVSRLDDEQQAIGGNSDHYEKAHQMFGYIAALEKCLREAKGIKGHSEIRARVRVKPEIKS